MSLKSMFLQLATNGKVVDSCEIGSVTQYIIIVGDIIATCILSELTPTIIQNAMVLVEHNQSIVLEIKLKNI